MVMATDGLMSFITFHYVDVQFVSGAQIGFSSWNGESYMVPGALTDDTVYMDTLSNVNIPGVFVYHVNDNG